MNLFELSAEFESLLKQAEQEAINADGEISEAIAEALENAEMAKEEKIANIIKYVKNLRSDAEELKKAELEMKARKIAKEKKADALVNYLKVAGVTKYETTEGVISSRKSKAVEIAIDADIPAAYITTKVTESPDKTALKKAILGGEVIEGVEVVERLSVQVK